MPGEDVKESDKTVVVLRKGNVKKYVCDWCGEVFNSRQALRYHQHTSPNPCPKKPADAGPLDNQGDPAIAEQDPATGEPGPLSGGDPSSSKTKTEASGLSSSSQENSPPPNPGGGPDVADLENEQTFDGDSPPIPVALYVLLAFLIGIVVLQICLWDYIWKFWHWVGSSLGGERDDGAGEQPGQ